MKTIPQQHQEHVYKLSCEKEYFAYFLEQGLGKTKIALDVAFHLHSKGAIDNVLVLAPNGVHLNWHYSELPKHGWDDNYISAVWRTAKTKKQEAEIKGIIEPNNNKLRFLFANIESIRSPRGHKVMLNFIQSGRCFMVIDESTSIKNPKALQTKAAIKLGRQALYKRILTGTPMTQGPLDLFSQCQFLSPFALPIPSYTAFKNKFAIEETMNMGQRSFNKVVGYRHLDQLQTMLKPFSVRLTKRDCLDLPDKIYQRQYVEFTKEQEQTYQSIKETQVAQLWAEQEEKGFVSVTNVLSALTKLHQICCGFIIDDEGTVHEIKNNRFEALDALTDKPDEKFVIWTTYRASVKQIVKHLQRKFGRDAVVSYFGETSGEDRVAAVEQFSNNPEVRFFVANRTGSQGITLTSACNSIYFASGYSLQDRLQSEDRVHRIGQEKVCIYTDILTPGTVEEKILNVLQSKQELSNSVITSDWKNLLS